MPETSKPQGVDGMPDWLSCAVLVAHWWPKLSMQTGQGRVTMKEKGQSDEVTQCQSSFHSLLTHTHTLVNTRTLYALAAMMFFSISY
jgi:hypothetical protein